MINQVFSYYDFRLGLKNDFKLIGLCAQSWAKHGWGFTLLNEEVAKRSEFYSAVKEKMRAYPTVNNPEYELICFLRWCALEAVGGGLFIDYDMINYGFGCREFSGDTILSYGGKNHIETTPPVFLTHEGVRKLIQCFLTWPHGLAFNLNGRPHLSDMHVISVKLDWLNWIRENVCYVYERSEGWETAQLVHYSNSSSANRDSIESIRPI
jgi:hypothetical protein